MKRALLSTLGALACVAMAMPASASSYGWTTSFTGGNEWMTGSIGGSEKGEYTAEKSSRGSKRAARQYRDDDEPVTRRSNRRSAAVSSEARSSGGGQSGVASYYWQPQRVASGGWFNPNAMTAAHKTLPFGTKVRVTHQASGRSAVVTINDRGPYVAGRIIDLSSAAAGVIGMKGSGVARVQLTVLGR